ncbi:monooxygenase [Purpureocillium lavendulum]|uniref:Monooxygenase n=1 Tax=Purpureocillium lavendulum TaxID=1247861 RepID=A0AB34FXL6_9HYPO|nr:monooxygenase [Purpureocillium lavendulum]
MTHGIHSTVLEAWDGPDERLRATQYGVPATRIFRRAGILDDIRSRSIMRFPYICWRSVRTGERLTGIDLSVVSDEPDRMTVLPLNQILEIMLQHCKEKYSDYVTVLFNHKVIDIGQDAAGAWTMVEVGARGEKTTTAKFEADYLVGCDGGRSTVYYKGFEEHGWEGGNYMIDPEFWGLIAKRGKGSTGDGPLWRVTYGDSATNLTDDEYVRRRAIAFKKMLPGHPDPDQYKVTQTNQFRIHNRCVDAMRVGRVFLAGDAAHVCNPFGGYGCMAAVLDVAGLADCLVGYYEGKAGEDILDAYARVRRQKFVDFIDRRSRKNMNRIAKTDPGTALETDPFLELLQSMEGDAEKTKAFLLFRQKVSSIEFDFTTLYNKTENQGERILRRKHRVLGRAADADADRLARHHVDEVVVEAHGAVLALDGQALDGHLGADAHRGAVIAERHAQPLRLLQVQVLERLGPVDVARELHAVAVEVRRHDGAVLGRRLAADGAAGACLGAVAGAARGHRQRGNLGGAVRGQELRRGDGLGKGLLAGLDVPRLDDAVDGKVVEGEVGAPDLDAHLALDSDARVLGAGAARAAQVLPARHADGQGRHLALDGEVGVLGPQVVVADGPRRDGPAVVGLPDEGAAAVLLAGPAPLALPQAVRRRQALGLHELRAVDVVLERVGRVPHVLDQVQRQASLVARRLVVEVDRRRLRVPVRVVAPAREEALVDGLDVREGLHAELGHEAPHELVEVLVLFLRAVPHVPLVDVAGRRVGRVVAAPGAARVVVGVGDEVLADVGQQLLVDVARGEVGLEPVVRVHVAGVVREPLLLGELVVLVVAGPDDETGVVPQHLDVLPRLAVDGLEDVRVRGVVAAAKHKVLPDEDAHLVAGVVEGLVLVDAAAPDADHELVALGDDAHPVAVARRGDAREEVVGGDPVAAAAEDGHVVDAEEEGRARLAVERALDELGAAQADALRDAVGLIIAVEERRLDGVQRLLAVADRVPQLWVLDLEGRDGGVVGDAHRLGGYALVPREMSKRTDEALPSVEAWATTLALLSELSTSTST